MYLLGTIFCCGLQNTSIYSRRTVDVGLAQINYIAHVLDKEAKL